MTQRLSPTSDREILHILQVEGEPILALASLEWLMCADNAKWTFLAFFSIFELGSLLCGAAQSSKMLIIGRAVAGMGASGLNNGALTIVATTTPMEKRPALIGAMMGLSQMGLVLGPVIGGALTEYTTWRWCKSSSEITPI